tara:strand:+ start:173 stop:454 length:282 start_codon:yes stop_codon:yes gene_type:complete
MDENKKSLLVHYLTEFVLVIMGIGIFFIILYLHDFHFSFNIISQWVFLYNGVLFTYWLWQNNSKIWEKSIVGAYFVIIEIIIASSFTTLSING